MCFSKKKKLQSFQRKSLFSWRPPRHILAVSEEEHAAIRRKKGILVDGDNVPPPIGSFIVSFLEPFLILLLNKTVYLD